MSGARPSHPSRVRPLLHLHTHLRFLPDPGRSGESWGSDLSAALHPHGLFGEERKTQFPFPSCLSGPSASQPARPGFRWTGGRGRGGYRAAPWRRLGRPELRTGEEAGPWPTGASCPRRSLNAKRLAEFFFKYCTRSNIPPRTNWLNSITGGLSGPAGCVRSVISLQPGAGTLRTDRAGGSEQGPTPPPRRPSTAGTAGSSAQGPQARFHVPGPRGGGAF